MSHQSSDLPIVEEGGSRGNSKKTKGQFEVWVRSTHVRPGRPEPKWSRLRKYKSRPLAEENAKDFDRKWNACFISGRTSAPHEPHKPDWEFEVRPKE
jgi:hypothetical protein